MNTVGKAGLWTLMVTAVAAWFLMAPAEPVPAVFTASAQDYASVISTAVSDYDANNALAESAPQQQVVNGWVAKDLLTIVAYQNVDLLESLEALGEQGEQTGKPASPDERVPALLGIGVLAVGWIGLNRPRSVTAEVTP